MRFLALCVGLSWLIIGCVAITLAALSGGDWSVTLVFNRFHEGWPELVLLYITTGYLAALGIRGLK